MRQSRFKEQSGNFLHCRHLGFLHLFGLRVLAQLAPRPEALGNAACLLRRKIIGAAKGNALLGLPPGRHRKFLPGSCRHPPDLGHQLFPPACRNR